MKKAIFISMVFLVSLLHSTDAICKRGEELKDWKRKGLIERAVESDIIIYGQVFFSPCWKPGYTRPVTTTTPSPTTVPSTQPAEANSTTSNTTTAPSVEDTTPTPTPEAVNTTTQPVIPYNCSTEFYSATIKVHCVIKGGVLPAYILLKGFGHGAGICFEESYHDYHAYRDLDYVIFIGRKKEVNGTTGFWVNSVNHQPAATEIHDESMLKPLFEAAGRNAHHPFGVTGNKTHELCKPFEKSSAQSWGCSFLTPLLTLVAILSFLQMY